jgi:hypothetical protein
VTARLKPCPDEERLGRERNAGAESKAGGGKERGRTEKSKEGRTEVRPYISPALGVVDSIARYRVQSWGYGPVVGRKRQSGADHEF